MVKGFNGKYSVSNERLEPPYCHGLDYFSCDYVILEYLQPKTDPTLTQCCADSDAMMLQRSGWKAKQFAIDSQILSPKISNLFSFRHSDRHVNTIFVAFFIPECRRVIGAPRECLLLQEQCGTMSQKARVQATSKGNRKTDAQTQKNTQGRDQRRLVAHPPHLQQLIPPSKSILNFL